MRQISKLGERFGMATLGGAILQFLFLYLHFTTMYPVLTLYTMGAGYQARNGPAAKRLGPPTGQHGKGTYVFYLIIHPTVVHTSPPLLPTTVSQNN